MGCGEHDLPWLESQNFGGTGVCGAVWFISAQQVESDHGAPGEAARFAMLTRRAVFPFERGPTI
jgi:hypothetical protein